MHTREAVSRVRVNHHAHELIASRFVAAAVEAMYGCVTAVPAWMEVYCKTPGARLGGFFLRRRAISKAAGHPLQMLRGYPGR
jgi:hypothetical protein